MKKKNDLKIKGRLETPFKLCLYTFIISLSLIYIIFRIFFTLPLRFGVPTAILGIFILVLEIIEFLDYFNFYLNVLCYNKHSPKIPKVKKSLLPEVDVFIATINESVDLVEGTIKACLKMKYPNKKKIHIYICDDGHRKEMEDLAKKYNIGYITRNDNKDAKAGNYNNALKHSYSPYIATLDADMQPTPEFLMTTMPFFVKEKRVGFVQLPQSFSNPDIYQLRFGLTDEIPFEQDYFYTRIQIAKNNTNSAIYCGTNAVLSRESLESVNGFSINNVTEDIATGMAIESKGYRGIALTNIEAYGDAVNDLESYAKQQSRWARGGIQILKKQKILTNDGLSLRQKAEYLSAIFHWYYGVRRVIYFIMPLLFSFFGILVIDCNLIVFCAFFFPPFLLKRFGLDLLEYKKKSATWCLICEVVMAPFMALTVLKETFGAPNSRWDVSPKNKINTTMTKTNRFFLICHSFFLLLSILGLGVTFYRIYTLELYAYILPLIWISGNIFYLTVAVIFDLRLKPVYYENFVPNEATKYSLKSIPMIFTSIFRKKMN